MNRFNTLALYLFVMGFLCLGGCKENEPQTPPTPPITEYIEWVEVNNMVPKKVDIDHSRRKITFDFKAGTDLKVVEITFTLAEGVEMVSPTTTTATFDLTDIIPVKVKYSGKIYQYNLVAYNDDVPDIEPQKGTAYDISLIYYGGSHRSTQWTAEELNANVVYVDTKGVKHWLFDTFLFSEIITGTGYEYEHGHSCAPARRQEWEWLLEKYFNPNGPIYRLNQEVRKATTELGQPKYKRKLIINLPSSIKGQTDWGLVSGKKLDFNVTADRITALKWYIDNTIARYEAANLKYLEIEGFYFVAEQLTGNREFLPAINDYIKSKGLNSYWVPYNGADGTNEWKAMKFDYAYFQPNYFFPAAKLPYSFLTDAINFSKSQGMSVEMEFDERALSKSADYRADRLKDYIKAFKDGGVFSTLSIVYYQSDCMIHSMKTSKYSEDVALYHELCSEIMARQHRLGEK